jgi:SAM-dependent methyltransferase
MTFQLAGDGPEIYEKYMVPLWFGRWAEALIESVALKPRERVLDVACGTGVTSRLAKDKVGLNGRVDGLDINASMLSKAREIAGEVEINWIESDASNTGLPSGSYDVVLSQHGYHYFTDKPAALIEFRRLLRSGGRIAFSIWDGHSPYTLAICAAVEKFISPEIAAKQRSQRLTPLTKELQDQVNSAGFSGVDVERQELMIDVPLAEEFVPLHLCSMPIAGAYLALDETAKNALINEVSRAMEPYIQGNRLVYPDAVHVVCGYTSM